jgi:multimeric flavodoxin WrbA
MHICGLVGSPNKRGNVDLLVSQVLEGARSRGAEIEKTYLNDLKIRPCQSCGEDPYPKYCFFEDDMGRIYQLLQSCDAVVLGSPVYFDTVSAQVKLMIDRTNCLMAYTQRPNGGSSFTRRMTKRKKGVFIAVAGEAQEFETILTTVKGFFHWANIVLTDSILYPTRTTTMGRSKRTRKG